MKYKKGEIMVYYKLNYERDGIELYFEGESPSDKLVYEMRKVKLLYNHKKDCWFTKQWNREGVEFIKNYCKEKEPQTTTTFESIPKKRYCYADTIANFKKEDEDSFMEKMKTNFKGYGLKLSDEQIDAWRDSYRVLEEISLDPNINIIFEYVLPYEGGRRPDTLLLSKERVVVLEFKMKKTAKQLEADIDQVSGYARDLIGYHYETREKEVTPILVLTQFKNLNEKINNVKCVSGDLLQNTLDNIYTENINSTSLEKWIKSKYEPLPTIIDAARIFYKNEELPNIRRVNSTCIPQALENLKELSDYARENKKHTIAFVTGVPGSGKTFLGLEYVYGMETNHAVYLSGNKALIDVLTDALKSKAFVKNLHKIIGQYIDDEADDFNNNVIVFDEGQRAWNKKQMFKRHRKNLSEPDVMIKLCEEHLNWCVLLILVGEGQEINTGENSGIKLWDEAIKKGTKDWEILCPPNLYSCFGDQTLIENIDNSSFNLTISLRSHLSGCVSDFVNYFIDGDMKNASKLSDNIFTKGYNMYCTRNLESAKSYCRKVYKDSNKKYGLIASSKDEILRNYGMNNSFNATKGYAKWFNSSSDDPNSCCALNKVLTEFGVQGLELDMPIIGWETDMIWKNNKWDISSWNQEGETYRRNAYRVLLTRGRDGFIVFVPNERKLDPVYDILKEVGVKELN